jgi:hypothetical protein
VEAPLSLDRAFHIAAAAAAAAEAQKRHAKELEERLAAAELRAAAGLIH